jgi:hypothetical protein
MRRAHLYLLLVAIAIMILSLGLGSLKTPALALAALPEDHPPLAGEAVLANNDPRSPSPAMGPLSWIRWTNAGDRLTCRMIGPSIPIYRWIGRTNLLSTGSRPCAGVAMMSAILC